MAEIVDTNKESFATTRAGGILELVTGRGATAEALRLRRGVSRRPTPRSCGMVKMDGDDKFEENWQINLVGAYCDADEAVGAEVVRHLNFAALELAEGTPEKADDDDSGDAGDAGDADDVDDGVAGGGDAGDGDDEGTGGTEGIVGEEVLAADTADP